MRGRVQYLDLLKAVSIFLVVFCHFVLLPETVAANLWMCACWMAVPVFFMVNGALLFARPFQWERHLRKTAGVYGVFVIWKGIYLLLIPPASGVTVTAGAWEICNYLFLFGELPGIINGHLWFIEALLAVYLVYPAFRLAWEAADAKIAAAASGGRDSGGEGSGAGRRDRPGRFGKEGRRLLLFFAAAALLCTDGLYSLEIFGDMLRRAGLSFGLSFQSLTAFQPFGKYGNMLGFFLLGALLDGGGRARIKGEGEQTVRKGKRVLGGCMLAAGLLLLWGVKWFLSGRPEWDGILLQEGYRHVPVILMAVGLFFLCRDAALRPGWLAAGVEALARRTLGIFYVHWLMGWLLVNPLAAWFMTRGIPFGVWTNVLKNIVLMVPAFLVTLVLERIPAVRKLVKG